MIIEATTNQTFEVRDAEDPRMAHVWLGFEVKRSKGAWVRKAKAREQLVRKAGSKIIEAAR